MTRRKRLNVVRRAGRFYFKRKTRRLHDGTPDGEILWVMDSNRKPRRVSYVTNDGLQGKLTVHLSTYRLMSPVQVAHAIKDYLS